MQSKTLKTPSTLQACSFFSNPFWNSASWPLLFLPSYGPTSFSKPLTLRKIQCIALEPKIWKRWFTWAFQKNFFFCYAVFTWIWTYKTHGLTDHQLIVGSFLQQLLPLEGLNKSRGEPHSSCRGDPHSSCSGHYTLWDQFLWFEPTWKNPELNFLAEKWMIGW